MDTTRTQDPAERARAGHDQPAPPGFISAFDFAGGDALRLSWDEARRAVAGDGFTWLHLSANDDTVESWLEGVTSMPDVAREFLNGEDKRRACTWARTSCTAWSRTSNSSRRAGCGLAGRARGQSRDERAALFRGPPPHDYRAGAALQSTDRLRHAVLEGATFRDTVDLFAGLIRALNETFVDRIDDIGDRLDDVEEGVLENRQANWRAHLGDVRRRLVEVKRFIDPERNALTQLVTRRLEWAEPRSMEALVQAIQVLNGLGAGLEGLYERAKLLQDEIAALLSEDINRKLLWLAIMSALLMPATLLTGIFGMNVAGLPGTHNPASFWIVIGVMAGCAAITIYLLRKLRVW